MWPAGCTRAVQYGVVVCNQHGVFWIGVFPVLFSLFVRKYTRVCVRACVCVTWGLIKFDTIVRC